MARTTLAAILLLNRHTGTTRTYDLTINTLHTYYVLAGTTPVLVHNCGGSEAGHSENCTCDGKPNAEVTIDQGSFEQARNTALELAGPVSPGSRVTTVGRLEKATTTFGKETGFTGRDGGGAFKQFRLDFDPAKGPHINVMLGKGSAVRKWAVTWPGTEESFAAILEGNTG